MQTDIHRQSEMRRSATASLSDEGGILLSSQELFTRGRTVVVSDCAIEADLKGQLSWFDRVVPDSPAISQWVCLEAFFSQLLEIGKVLETEILANSSVSDELLAYMGVPQAESISAIILCSNTKVFATPDSRFLELLEIRLRRDFEEEPLEDCILHAAEKTIADALNSGREAAVLEFLQNISLDKTSPWFASSVFRCLARQEAVGSADWRVALVRSGLASDKVAIRDAAAQAADSWDDPGMRAVLEQHSESVHWLAAYIRKIITDS